MIERANLSMHANTDDTALGRRVETDAVGNSLLRQALAVWSERKGARRFPTRDDLNPRTMAQFLRNIVLVRVVDGSSDYQFRVVGDAIVQVQGRALQGMTLTEIDGVLPGYGAELRKVYDRVAAEGIPFAYCGQIARTPAKRPFYHESVLLPLGADEARVDHILVVGVYAYTSEVAPAR